MAGIRAEKVYKIFGDEPGIGLKLLRKGKTKDEIQSETGLVVGVQDVSFQLESGELYVIMGLSGSGKSTLLRCINRLVEPTSGQVYLEADEQEIELTSISQDKLRKIREKQMSMVFQSFALFPHRTVLENVTFGLEIQGADKKERSRKAKEIIDMVGLKGWGDSYPSQLSGGMQQRVGLARALATEAKILLMDEPFSALDPLIKIHMQDELLKLQDRLQRTILFVTHDLDEALKLGDRIAIMEAGLIVQSGTPEEIIVNPRTEYVANFVENADPSGVLTAGTIASTVSSDPSRFQDIDEKLCEDNHGLLLKDSEIICCIDKKGRFLKGIQNGKTLPVKRLEEGKEESRAEKLNQGVLLAVGEDTPIQDIMEARMNTSDHPVIILSDSGKFKGIITEQDILRGLLKKGRKEEEETEEGVRG